MDQSMPTTENVEQYRLRALGLSQVSKELEHRVHLLVRELNRLYDEIKWAESPQHGWVPCEPVTPRTKPSLKVVKLREQRSLMDNERVNLTQKARRVENEATRMIMRYAELTCKPLCESMHRELPPELRDAVYEQISTWRDPVDVDHYFSHATGQIKSFFFMAQKKWQSQQGLFGAFYWDPRFVGDVVARELIGNWYRTSSFLVTHDRLLERFLNGDRWEMGVVPKDILTNITVSIPEESYANPARHDELLENLRSLLGMKKPGVSVTIRLNQRFPRGPRAERAATAFRDILGLIFPVLHALNGRGSRLTLVETDSALRLGLSSDKGEFSVERWCKQRRQHLAVGEEEDS